MGRINWWSIFMLCFTVAALVSVWTEQPAAAVTNAVLAVAMAIMTHHK